MTLTRPFPTHDLLRPMLYKFRSAATGDLILLGPDGDTLMRILGREPAPKGIIEAADLPAAIAALERAVSEERDADRPGSPDLSERAAAEFVHLRQRAQPVLEMFRRAQRADKPVVWGV